MDKQSRVMVCVTGQRTCERLIHMGAEIAKEKEEALSVVHVARTGNNFLGSPSESEALEYLYGISKNYEADMMLLRADNVIETLTLHARKIGANTLVIGGTQAKGKKDITYALRSAMPEVDICVAYGEEEG